MPRYRYQCTACKATQMIFHLIDEVPSVCQHCDATNKLTKLLTTPTIARPENEIEESRVGELTNEYIEINREVLEQQKEEIKKEDYEPS